MGKVHFRNYPVLVRNGNKKQNQTTDEIKNVLKNIRRNILILSQTVKTIDDALDSDFDDFEDALQYFAAVHNKADYIISRNKKDYSSGIIPVYTPKEFLEYLERA